MKRMKFLAWVKGKTPEGYPVYDFATLSREAIHNVLDGQVSDLLIAFYWGGTPQGTDHWSSIQLSLKPLGEKDVDYLYFLLAECDRRGLP